MSLAPPDWIALVALLASVALGVWRGLVYEVMSVLSWVAAFVLAQWLAGDAAARLPMSGASEPVRLAAGFSMVFVATAFAGGLLAWLTKKAVEAIGLRPVDRTLGAAFGLLRALVILLALVLVVDMTPLRRETWMKDSISVALLGAALRGMGPVLPAAWQPYLPRQAEDR